MSESSVDQPTAPSVGDESDTTGEDGARAPTDGEGVTDEDAPAATTSWGATNWALIGLFGALTLAGVAITSGVLGTNVVAAPTEPIAGVTVPLFVYVYATLGAMGYVFTKLMKDLREYDEAHELGEVVEMLLRVPAAWVLAAGVYLATIQAGTNPAENPHLLATLAFLVGLYVNVAIKSLGALADRMLARGSAG